ncbi:MAG: HindIII family type II restriction endonuclease [Microscillaceae bacterium]|jgi:hypothetical protein|nr:HindIII family type II restriction endonuclease [Microscillaceae bacterium]
MKDSFLRFFDKDFSQTERIASYDYLENYISDTVNDWTTAPDTERIALDFAQKIGSLDKNDFAFLLCHAGYIPEFYEHDSSQETLYSKLIEILVCEWAKRVGFKDSSTQKQKASKEDITIQIDNTIIVCDAKSFRLGRSQAAPNVKDTIKKADYEKWQNSYLAEPNESYGVFDTIGGLITFPSLHNWKGSSDAYLYATDKHKPIVIIFYEHLAFYYLQGYQQQNLIEILNNYG